VRVAYHRRNLPVAWGWQAGVGTTRAQAALLDYVRLCLSPLTQVTLAGDCEFVHPLLRGQSSHWHRSLTA
jgi:hypothetical protein